MATLRELITGGKLVEIDLFYNLEDMGDYASIAELSIKMFTEAGLEAWKDVLDSQVVLIFGDNIHVEGCSAARLREFEFSLAGYVPGTLFQKWFKEAE